ncbi:MAG: PQ-loop repeat-containing protein [Clostridium butyricum]
MNLQLISSILASFGSGFLIFSYLPQIKQLFKTHNTEGMSVSFWVILLLGLICTTTNMVINNNPMSVLIPQFLNITLATVVLIQIIVYRRKK